MCASQLILKKMKVESLWWHLVDLSEHRKLRLMNQFWSTIEITHYISVSNDIIGDDDTESSTESQFNNKCTYGYRFFLVSCIDIDECAEDTHGCSSGEICFNYDGGYGCDKVY